jgi:hypothetical protein
MGVRGEIFSNKVALPNRTYFFNVKENRMGDLYLNIVESKNKDSGGFDRQSVILFADDLQEFLKGFDESLKVLEKATREKKHSGKTTAKKSEETRPEKDGRSRERSGSSGREFGGGRERGSGRKEYGNSGRSERKEFGNSGRGERKEYGNSGRGERKEFGNSGRGGERGIRNRGEENRGERSARVNGRSERHDRSRSGRDGERGKSRGQGNKRVVVRKRD